MLDFNQLQDLIEKQNGTLTTKGDGTSISKFRLAESFKTNDEIKGSLAKLQRQSSLLQQFINDNKYVHNVTQETPTRAINELMLHIETDPTKVVTLGALSGTQSRAGVSIQVNNALRHKVSGQAKQLHMLTPLEMSKQRYLNSQFQLKDTHLQRLQHQERLIEERIRTMIQRINQVEQKDSG